jgi:hypothetical protein
MTPTILPVNDWAQLSNEPAQAYAGFVAFLALGPWREIRLVAQQLWGEDPPRRAQIARVKHWSDEFDWDRRAASYDAYSAKEIVSRLSLSRLKLIERVMKNAQLLNEHLSAQDIRGVTAYTRMALEAARMEVGLAQTVIAHHHVAGSPPTPVVEITLEEYLTQAQGLTALPLVEAATDFIAKHHRSPLLRDESDEIYDDTGADTDEDEDDATTTICPPSQAPTLLPGQRREAIPRKRGRPPTTGAW